MPEIKRFPFTPILGWSATRYDLFSICKRQYFFHYYTKYDPDVPAPLLNQLKALVTIPLETGGIVHEVIEALLNRLKTSVEDIDTARFFDFADRTVRNRIRTRKFEEVVYGERPAIGVDDLSPKIRECLANLLESDRFAWLADEAVTGSAEWLIDPPGYGETRLGDLKIYCKVDFLFPVGDEYHIIDWKTGKPDPEKHRKQLIGYSTWASYHFETDPAHVRPTIAYLHPAYEEIRESFGAGDLANFAVQVRAETQEMYDYCRDVEMNIPLEKAAFPRVDTDKICAFCNFRGICFPERYRAEV
jgi:CRISPR/Cas system-associated exonuclease Cas4 (RecB family)